MEGYKLKSDYLSSEKFQVNESPFSIPNPNNNKSVTSSVDIQDTFACEVMFIDLDFFQKKKNKINRYFWKKNVLPG